MSKITAFLFAMRQRQDLALIGILLTAIIVMIIPMPTIMIDVLIAFNISLTMLILIVAVYLDRPTSFSTFPAIILIATTFRLAISISTTRTVLTTAEGGAIIETFGNFVTGGNIVVGLVIFLIITIVQFMVITKGAERVAEVAARFVLDALPGRQMSIDAELRAGDLTPDEARRRRRHLDKENQFFGAMDGAMKFVKGVAIAGLLIIGVNIIGGIASGTTQLGMSIGQASHTFSLLTIGDGLVAQIPALLLALCSGAVVTRVATDETNDLGKDIANELTNSSRTLYVAGGVVSAIGLVPGFPTFMFIIFGALLGWMGYNAAELTKKRDADAREAEALRTGVLDQGVVQTIEENETAQPKASERLVIRAGTGLFARIDTAAFVSARDSGRSALARRIGFSVSRFGVIEDKTVPEHGFAIDLDQVPLFNGMIPADAIAVECDRQIVEIQQIPFMNIPTNWRLRRVTFVRELDEARLLEGGLPILRPADLLVRLALRLLHDHAGQIVGYDDIQKVMDQARKEAPKLAEQVNQALNIATISDIFRRLVDEKVPMAPLRTLLEALLEWAPRESDPAILAEHARGALRRQICHTLADSRRMIAAYVIEPDLERELRDALRVTESGVFMTLPSKLANSVLAQLETVAQAPDPNAPEPVIVTAVDLRRHMQTYLRSHNMPIPVISYQEVASEFQVQPIGTLTVKPVAPPSAKAA